MTHRSDLTDEEHATAETAVADAEAHYQQRERERRSTARVLEQLGEPVGEPSIAIVDRVGSNDQHLAQLSIRVGDQQLHFVGSGATAEDARRDVERAFAGAVEDLEHLGEIRRRTGKINWRALL